MLWGWESEKKALQTLLEDMDALLVLERSAPRKHSGLSEFERERLRNLNEELERLREDREELKARLKELRDQLLNEFKIQVPDDSSDLWDWIWEWLSGEKQEKVRKVLGELASVASQLLANRKSIKEIENEIHRICYTEPGVVTSMLYNANEALERFNTIEQPKIEDILDSADGNLQESEEILRQVKGLFVTKRRVPIIEAELPPWVRERLVFFTGELSALESVAVNDQKLIVQLRDFKTKLQPTSFQVDKGISTAVPGALGGANVDPPAEPSTSVDNNIGGTNIPAMPSGVSKPVGAPEFSKAIAQPVAFKTMRGLDTASGKYYAVNSKYMLQKAYLKLHLREIDKTQAEIDKIRFREIQEPGVIPRTIAKLEDILVRLNSEEQPRLEQIIDSINGNLTESQGILNKVNTSIGNLLNFISSNSLLFKIGLAIVGGSIAITLILIPILIIRMIFFGL